MPWRAALKDLVARGTFRTQAELVRALAAAGHEVNQATVSRELAHLGARKVKGAYELPARVGVDVPLHAFATTAAECLAIVRTDPAFANVLARSIDAAALPGVLGTIAGDDTVFIATTGPSATARIAAFLGREDASHRGPRRVRGRRGGFAAAAR